VSAKASRITTYFRVCDGVRVRYADTRADSDITVLMLAPWPETLWAFRRIWQRVTALGRVVAIDMPASGIPTNHERSSSPRTAAERSLAA
jgi:pimeloyl-ACP methyl ester carboxylesterase